MSTVESRHLAKQLLKFAQTDHPNFLASAELEDLSIAQAILGDDQDNLDVTYPVEWVDGKRNFRNFIRSWRHKFAKQSRAQAQPSTYQQESSEQNTSIIIQKPLIPTPLRPNKCFGPLIFPNRRQRALSDPETPQRRAQLPDLDPILLSPLTTSTSGRPPRHSGWLELGTSDIKLSTPDSFVQLTKYSKIRTPSSRSISSSISSPFGDLEDNSESIEFPRATTRSMSAAGSGAGIPPADNGNNAGNVNVPPNNGHPGLGDDPLTARLAAQLLAQAFAQVNMNRPPQQQPQGNGANNGGLTPDLVGYFNPKFPDPYNIGVVPSGKYTVYTNVYAFADRLRELSNSWGDDKVKAVWSACLQQNANGWLSTELSPMEKDALTNGNVEYICKQLINRFRKEPSLALQELKTRSFTLWDLRKNRSMRTFVQSIIRDAKCCDLPLQVQLLYAFEAFDVEIQMQLDKPTKETTIGKFLSQIDARESILRAKANQLPSNKPMNQPNQSPAQYGKPNVPYVHRQMQQGNQANQPYVKQNNRYQNQQFGYPPRQAGQAGQQYQRWNHNNQPQQNYQKPPPYNYQQPQNYQRPPVPGTMPYMPQAIPQVPQMPPQQQWPPQNQPPRQQGNWNAGNWNGRQPQNGKVYMADESQEQSSQDDQGNYGNVNHADQNDQGQWQGDDQNYNGNEQQDYGDNQNYVDQAIESCGNIPDGFGPPNTDDNGGYDVANFGVVAPQPKPSTCDYCDKHFSSRNKLFRHISKEHADKSRPATTDTAQIAVEMNPILMEIHHADDRMKLPSILNPKSPEQASNRKMGQHPSTTTKSKIPIHPSTIDARPDVGTGFAYKTTTYLKIFLMTSVETEHEEDICADTGCTRTIADKAWIQSHYPGIEIRNRATPILIRGIASDSHVINQKLE